MNTLDEVSTALGDATVHLCNIMISKETWHKSLHYLKAYKDDKDDLTALRSYWAEQQANPVLSWDELRQMEGKPVWIEEYDAVDSTRGWRYCRWMLIEFVNDSYMDARNSDGEQYNFDKGEETWQAYRKEHHE